MRYVTVHNASFEETLSVSLTVGGLRGVGGVELVIRGNEADACLHAIVRVVSRRARNEVCDCRG